MDHEQGFESIQPSYTPQKRRRMVVEDSEDELAEAE